MWSGASMDDVLLVKVRTKSERDLDAKPSLRLARDRVTAVVSQSSRIHQVSSSFHI
jgi:hypothetical protein